MIFITNNLNSFIQSNSANKHTLKERTENPIGIFKAEKKNSICRDCAYQCASKTSEHSSYSQRFRNHRPPIPFCLLVQCSVCLKNGFYGVDRVDGRPVRSSTENESKKARKPNRSSGNDAKKRNRRACIALPDKGLKGEFVSRVGMASESYTIIQIEVPGTSRSRVNERPRNRPVNPSAFNTFRITPREVVFATDLGWDCSI